MKVLTKILAGVTPLLVAGVAKAQYSDFNDYEAVEAAAVTGTGLLAFGVGILIILSLPGLIFLGLWIWALVDVLGRSFPEESEKKTWMWLVILSWPVPVVVTFIPGIGVLSSILGLAGIVIIVVYLASIRKQGTKKSAPKVEPKVEEKK